MHPVVFQAPWSRQLKIISLLSAALLLAIPVILLAKSPQTPSLLFSLAIALPPVILLLGAGFSIRGYSLDHNRLQILRPGWKTSISLEGLHEAKADPAAMQGSVRIFGNSGLFGYIGLFQNKPLGRFRAFATDQQKAVVLRFPGKTLVITPDNPARMIEMLRQKIE
ncbi:PH domain-containing protein [uncultured Microbulbifer sp.]|uniref:PH domain-containing protein n=1 Tax=uncultured Microbulbifer sp. TaxID=348147 RepID=UPI00262A950E|nr:PH domain-containing protein [uncultured Microbulbifer sp.]